jgi:hypothetical protein
MARQRYRNGDWFAAPLGDGTYALGRIARQHGGIVFGYFFAPPFDHVPSLDEVGSRTAADSATQMLFSHLGLRDGEWPILGQAGDWEPAEWPLVEFERRIDDKLFAVHWDEETLNDEVSSVRIDPSEAGRRPSDALAGAGAAVARLRRLLGVET